MSENTTDLTTRARAVIAGLSDAQRKIVVEHSAGRRPSVRQSTVLALSEAGVIRPAVSNHRGRFGLKPITDLGREVARLIAEGSA